MGGRLEEALRACRKAVRARPDHAEAHMLLAEAQRLLGDRARAEESTARALRLRPGWAPANIQLAVGDLYRDFGRMDEAESRYRAALALQPEFDDARYNLAGLLYGVGRRAEAVPELEHLLERHPEAPDVRERLVQLLYEERQIARLEAVCREGVRLFPRASVYRGRLGAALWFLGRYEPGLQAYRDALDLAETAEIREEAALSVASALLALDRREEGWRAFRGRYSRVAVTARFPGVIDDPGRIATLQGGARIRIRTEQGIGDELFFLRFAPELRRRGHRLSVEGEDKLVPLCGRMPGLFEPLSGEADFTLCSGDLPLASDQVFAPPLALPVDSGRLASLRAELERFGPPPYIGVTWRGGVLPDEAKPLRGAYLQKKLPPEEIGKALAPVNARVVVLQRRPTAEDQRLFAGGLGRPALDMSRANDDLLDALALLSLLDEYTGVSNTNFHLRAGLPQKRTRVLVSMPADWRWSLSGRISPWFPGFQVYRRAFGDDWTKVLLELQADLLHEHGAVQQ